MYPFTQLFRALSPDSTWEFTGENKYSLTLLISDLVNWYLPLELDSNSIRLEGVDYISEAEANLDPGRILEFSGKLSIFVNNARSHSVHPLYFAIHPPSEKSLEHSIFRIWLGNSIDRWAAITLESVRSSANSTNQGNNSAIINERFVYLEKWAELLAVQIAFMERSKCSRASIVDNIATRICLCRLAKHYREIEQVLPREISEAVKNSVMLYSPGGRSHSE